MGGDEINHFQKQKTRKKEVNALIEVNHNYKGTSKARMDVLDDSCP
jgi:hypothetical protein